MNATATSRRPRSVRAVDVVIVGAGHSGLAMSHCLSERSIDHVVLERGEVANAWRHERWDSLRLLTPNWQCDLPGYAYSGDDPDGFMTMPEVIEFIMAYAAKDAAPVITETEVVSVRDAAGAFSVETSRGNWSARAIVIASGAFARPAVPAQSSCFAASITQCASNDYRNPAQLPDAGVLVVGASASGLQLAEEIQRSGRPVTLAVGEHIRMPRQYRGRDIQWWMSSVGVLDQTYREVDDITRARRVPSPQLVGTPERRTLDLNVLQDIGVTLAGRLVGVDGDKVQFSGSLANHCAMADLKLNRLLGTFDDWATDRRLSAELEAPSRPARTRVDDSPPLTIDLRKAGIESIVWATGLTPDYRWLDLPVFDRRGRIRHDGGVVAPGVYLMGLPFMRRRKSSYMHGAEDDARELSADLAAYLRDDRSGPLRRSAG
jgi:putative flavoprotein involved in K+ transport